MANRKINELSPRTPSLTDLIIVGDPSTGYSFKATISVLAAFAGSNIQFSSLQGISITSPTNGQALVYDGTNWVNQNISVPVTSVFGRTGVVVAAEGDYSLDLLSDVTLTSPTTNQVLQYNGTAWVNATFVAGINSLNGLTATTQTFATDLSGSDFAITSTTSTHTFSLPTASAVNRGALSSADWSTFNGKQDAITLTTTGSSGASTLVGATLNVPEYTLAGLGGVSGSGTTNYLPKWTGSTSLGNSLVFDNGTNVGIGTTSPAYKLDVIGDIRTNTTIRFGSGSSNSFIYAEANGYLTQSMNYQLGGSSNVFGLFRAWGSTSSTTLGGISTANMVNVFSQAGPILLYANANNIYFGSSNTSPSMTIVHSTKNVLIGTTTDGGQKFQVSGTASISGQTTIGGLLEIQSVIRVSTANQANPLQLYKAYNSTNKLIEFYGGIGSKLVYNTNTQILYPETNAGVSLGTSTLKYNNIYGTNGYFDTVLALGTTSPNASALLDITSTTKGLLLPRMTGLQAEAITGVDGLVIYANNGNGATITSTGFWGYAAGAWVKLN